MNDYSILKLSNGEDLICRVVNKTESDIVIESPLKMETINRMTNSGVTESLSLTRWLQPFSDEKDYTIGKNSIVISVPLLTAPFTVALKLYILFESVNVNSVLSATVPPKLFLTVNTLFLNAEFTVFVLPLPIFVPVTVIPDFIIGIASLIS